MYKKLFKGLISDSFIYGLSGMLSSFVSIFLIPIYTSVFEPADYGIISVLTTTAVVLNIFIVFSLDNSAAVWFWENPEHEERVKTFNSWLGFNLFAGGLLMVLIVGFSKSLSVLFFNSPKYQILFVLLGINLLFVGFQKAVNIWCRMLRKPLKAMMYSLGILVTTVSLNILFVVYLHIGVKGVFYSQLIAGIVGFLLMFVMLRRWVKISSFSMERLKAMIRFSLPLVPATLLYWLMNMASIYFMKWIIKDDAQIGLFQIGASVANVLTLVTWAFFQAWGPFALSLSRQENAKKIYSIVLEVFCICGGFVSLCLFLFAKDILLVFTNQKYLGAANIIGLLAINVILQGIPNIISIANLVTKKNMSYALAISIGSLISVIGFLLLIPAFGKEGAALAMIAGNLFVPFFLTIKVQRIYPVPYNFARIIVILLLQGSVFFVARYMLEGWISHLAVAFLVGCIIILSYYRIAQRKDLLKHFRLLENPLRK